MSDGDLAERSDLPPLPRYLDQVCDRFENAWKHVQVRGPRPRLEDFLAGITEPHLQTLLRELLAVETGYRRRLGERPTLAEYQQRLPDVPVAWLEGHFAAEEKTIDAEPRPGGMGVDEAAAATPQRIGRYRVERILGEGGFGIVYLAHDDQLKRPIAIKVPHRKLVARPEAAEAYLAEARTVANLDHPNIVPVYDVGSTENFPCFVV